MTFQGGLIKKGNFGGENREYLIWGYVSQEAFLLYVPKLSEDIFDDNFPTHSPVLIDHKRGKFLLNDIFYWPSLK